ncbi:MAG: EthD family reductase [Actinobacteria bacterium]|nr:MAG: EthD family reductase [Actinomycetota bacterium]
MMAPNIAMKVNRGTPSQSAQAAHTRDSSISVSPTSKNTARTLMPSPLAFASPDRGGFDMVRVHIWLRKKEGISADEFRDYWLSKHAPIARDGYEHLRGYEVELVTRVPEGQQAPYDGVAVLTWDERDGFSADMKSAPAKQATDDLENFTSGFGLLFVEHAVVK